ncbi:MAG: tRNA (adenosine(37)-N6)-threonylcarbamoyltransferase complex transferase subunit TsaD [Nitrospirae bacterium]|nr:tRNA (adenosine(37)-N6)-threonylcarbamoyltransferase complex transferase subunit TsaD [Nitrospirota bacterium]
MLILGIDTSCDDTSAAIVENGVKILSNIVSSQDEVHKKYGGIVPELASRRHIEMILPVVDEALKKAKVEIKDISAVAVCHGPGLIGSLLIGVCFAKSLSYVNNIPLVAANHLEGHIFSSFLEEEKPEFPFIALIASGGHTSLVRVDDFGRYKELGRTRDDAAGEAYDKVAKLLGLSYPGGPIIDRLAQEGNSKAIDFPRAYLSGTFDFSFSGLKTAVLNFLRKIDSSLLTRHSSLIKDIAASFQSAVVDVLVRKTIEAAKEEGVRNVVLSGGVSANSALRENLTNRALEDGLRVYLPSLQLCTDNAAMIASVGYFLFKNNKLSSMSLNPEAYLPL